MTVNELAGILQEIVKKEREIRGEEALTAQEITDCLVESYDAAELLLKYFNMELKP